MAYNGGIGFWKYSTKIKTVTFQKSINVPSNAIEKWDMSFKGNGKVMAYILDSGTPGYYDLYIQGAGDSVYAHPDSSKVFYNFTYLDKINNIDNFDTSYAYNMANMFNNAGVQSSTFSLDLGSKFNTKNVNNMYAMFYHTGHNSKSFTLDLGDNFDTSNVTNMYYMFAYTGYSGTNFVLDLGTKFNTSKVKDMSAMFYQTGRNSTNFQLNLRDNFDTSNVRKFSYMFNQTGYSSNKFNLNLGTKFSNIRSIKIIS